MLDGVVQEVHEHRPDRLVAEYRAAVRQVRQYRRLRVAVARGLDGLGEDCREVDFLGIGFDERIRDRPDVTDQVGQGVDLAVDALSRLPDALVVGRGDHACPPADDLEPVQHVVP
ncbi:hypothetical protein BRC83_07625 [Halobacteriales archaeon QS_1_68_17]|nr:MAG: hypothetical protein BRC83_07625 [Halobacteriales archaeon QS_1_68_17]